MTAAAAKSSPDAGATVRSVLFASEHDGDALRSWLHDSGALAPVVKAAAAFAGNLDRPISSQTSGAIGDLLSLNLVDVLLDAWSADGALLAAARTTAGHPDTTEHVTLLSQTVTWSSTPWVEIRVDDVTVGRFDVTLQVTIDITALEADVRSGAVVMFHSGACRATASLIVNGHTLVQRRVVDLGAPFQMRLRSGIPLAIVPPAPGGDVTPDANEAAITGRAATAEGRGLAP
jgi:hypothetical protein